MADNLNMGNDSVQNGVNSPINNVPTKSPLEQSGPIEPAQPSVESSPVNPPAIDQASAPVAEQPASPEPLATPYGQAVNPQDNFAAPQPAESTTVEAGSAAASAPAINNTDLGESAPAPDTDEFLKSILQEQPQTAAPASAPVEVSQDANAPLDQSSMPGENSSNPPLQDLNPVSSNNVPLQTPELNEKPIDQSINAADQFNQPAPSAELPIEPALQPPTPELSPEPNINNQKLTDSVSLDGIVNTPTAPLQAPQPNQDAPVSSNVFSGSDGQPKNSSGLKKLVIGVLVVVVLAGGYYAYSTMTSSTAKKPASSNNNTVANTQTTANNSNETVATGDTQRKSDLIAIQQALLDYYSASSQFPVSQNYTFLNQAGNLLEKELVPIYLSKMPQDPTASKAYAYKSDGKTFTLTAELDNANDLEAVMESGKILYKVTSSTTASGTTQPAGANAQATGTVVSSFPGSSNVDTAQVGGSTIDNSTNTSPPVPVPATP